MARVMGWELVWLARVELVLVLLGVALWVPMSRRVIVSWMTWATLRYRWRHQPESLRRWLWIRTLRGANGDDVPSADSGDA